MFSLPYTVTVPRKLVVSILVTLSGPSSAPHGYEQGRDPFPYTSWDLGAGGGVPHPPFPVVPSCPLSPGPCLPTQPALASEPDL